MNRVGKNSRAILRQGQKIRAKWQSDIKESYVPKAFGIIYATKMGPYKDCLLSLTAVCLLMTEVLKPSEK